METDAKTALITGASGGIGYELAKLFARDHHNLVLVARSSAKLAHFAGELERQFGISAKPIALDLVAAPAPQFLFDQLGREGISIDILVNNAGYGVLGEFAGVPLEESLGQIQLNVTALTQLTRLFLGSMLERHSGRILNVASTAGFQPGPRMAVYYATKAYVISFSEALANELSGTGVTVTCFCPGATDTGFQGRAGTENTMLFRTEILGQVVIEASNSPTGVLLFGHGSKAIFNTIFQIGGGLSETTDAGSAYAWMLFDFGAMKVIFFLVVCIAVCVLAIRRMRARSVNPDQYSASLALFLLFALLPIYSFTESIFNETAIGIYFWTVVAGLMSQSKGALAAN